MSKKIGPTALLKLDLFLLHTFLTAKHKTKVGGGKNGKDPARVMLFLGQGKNSYENGLEIRPGNGTTHLANISSKYEQVP